VKSADDIARYPAELADRYRRDGLWGTRTIGAELHATAVRFPDTEALVTPERRLTYADLDSGSDAVADRLAAAGLRSGDRVVLQIGNTAESVEAFYGLLKIGAVPVCSLPTFGHHEIDAIAALAGARAHLVQADLPKRDMLAFAAEVRAAVPTVETTFAVRGGGADTGAVRIDTAEATAEPTVKHQPASDAEALAILQLSGGTTGTPKLIPHLHCSYWYYGAATAERWGYRHGDRIAHFLPLVHNSGLHAALFAAHAVGATLVLQPTWQPEAVLDVLRRERITHTCTLTSLITTICDDPAFPEATKTLRRLSLALPAVPGELFDRLTARGLTIYQFFGMSEGFSTASPTDASDAMRRGTVGYPLSPADEFRLLGDDEPVAPGEAGELCVRGPYTLRGYLNAADHNAAAFTADGFLRTGDLARIVDIDGTACLRIVGRIKDLVSRGGEKINAGEIEELLCRHPAIQAAALIGLPDERLGERPCAVVITDRSKPALTLEAVTAFLSDRGVARFKWPERLEIVEEFPKTAIGKVLKRQLIEQLTAADAADANPEVEES
jgi:non-ribosomal peptide synthetase component E (peptide arylation enzyme)